jgi:hypothetical protein
MPRIVGFFKDIQKGDNAIQVLKSHGFDLSQISLRPYQQVLTNSESELATTNNEIAAGIAIGAVSGATLGLLIGSIVALSTLSVPIGGTISTAGTVTALWTPIAAGVAIGAVAGSLLLAGLTKLGFSAQRTERDGVAVSVQTPEARVLEARDVLHAVNAVETSIER